VALELPKGLLNSADPAPVSVCNPTPVRWDPGAIKAKPGWLVTIESLLLETAPSPDNEARWEDVLDGSVADSNAYVHYVHPWAIGAFADVFRSGMGMAKLTAPPIARTLLTRWEGEFDQAYKNVTDKYVENGAYTDLNRAWASEFADKTVTTVTMVAGVGKTLAMKTEGALTALSKWLRSDAGGAASRLAIPEEASKLATAARERVQMGTSLGRCAETEQVVGSESAGANTVAASQREAVSQQIAQKAASRMTISGAEGAAEGTWANQSAMRGNPLGVIVENNAATGKCQFPLFTILGLTWLRATQFSLKP